jgi:ribosome biogenesis GTPase
MNYEGLIIRATGGFYYVKCGSSVYECRARGIFRKDGISPLVGDMVKISLETELGMVDEILPRKNALVRPPLANLDRLIIISSAVEPPPDTFAIDKLIAIAEYNAIEPIIVFSKVDLSEMDMLTQLYTSAGFKTAAISSTTGEGIKEVAAMISHPGVSAFTGNSGVGKSSLLNKILPLLCLEVGVVSKKLGRGRHTTRTVELFEISGTGGECFVADTPGFSSLDILRAQFISKDQLQFAFREFAPFLDSCKYTGCAHVKETGCAVLEAVKSGEIASSRHASYCTLYNEVKDVKDWQRK